MLPRAHALTSCGAVSLVAIWCAAAQIASFALIAVHFDRTQTNKQTKATMPAWRAKYPDAKEFTALPGFAACFVGPAEGRDFVRLYSRSLKCKGPKEAHREGITTASTGTRSPSLG
jgi:hypothetical protein